VKTLDKLVVKLNLTDADEYRSMVADNIALRERVKRLEHALDVAHSLLPRGTVISTGTITSKPVSVIGAGISIKGTGGGSGHDCKCGKGGGK
jgi:hypothetical protein